MKERPEVVQEFVAYHLLLGASQVIIYFDDPDDPAVETVSHLPQVRVIRCDAEFVARRGKLPPGLPARQKAHARQAYAETTADWIIHIDADEFLSADRPISQILAETSGNVLRAPPFEAMETPRSAQGDRPEHFFRGALPANPRSKRIAEAAYGPFQDCLGGGMLSHQAGKFFVRSGIPGMSLAVHGPFLDGRRAAAEETQGLRLLHMHGGDYAHWRGHLERRLSDHEGGTYSGRLASHGSQSNNTTLLATLLDLHTHEGEAGLRRFFHAACTWGPEKRILQRANALWRGNMWRAAKRATVFGGDHRLSACGHDPQTGAFEADVIWHGLRLRVTPDDNYTECLIARGFPVEEAEVSHFENLARGRKVVFYDIGANAGIFSLAVAKVAAPGSRIIAFEPNPEMCRRFSRNVQMNALKGITLRGIALGATRTDAFLSTARTVNLGQGQLVGSEDGPGHRVPVSVLTDEMVAPSGAQLTLMKIDVEGHEPSVLAPLLDPARKKGHWPDIIMLEHTGAERWDTDLMGALESVGYAEDMRTAENTFLKRERTKG